MSNAIFDDLEIEYHDMLSDPDAFMSRVYERADELKEVLRTDTSLKAFEEKYRAGAKPAPTEIKELVEEIYASADDFPLQFLIDTIKQVRKLASDLETMFTDRCIYAAADSSNTIADKKTAHEQYTRLRESANSYISALKVLKADQGHDFKHLPTMPGNYGATYSSLIRYVFEYKEEQYRNHRYVGRLLGLENATLMDCLEFIEAHPECGVTVKKVS